MDHENEDTPCLQDVTNMAKNSKVDCQDKDQLLIIEQIDEIKSSDYLVKWLGYGVEDRTWEPSTNIPEFIRLYYNNPDNLGKRLPEPRIQHKKVVGGEEMYLLSWEGNHQDEEWVGDRVFKLFDLSTDVDQDAIKCNTVKHKVTYMVSLKDLTVFGGS